MRALRGFRCLPTLLLLKLRWAGSSSSRIFFDGHQPSALESLGELAVLLSGFVLVLLCFLLALEFFVLLKAKVNHRAPS